MPPQPNRRSHHLVTTMMLAIGLMFLLLGQLAQARQETAVSCHNNLAANTYPCRNIDLLAFVPLTTFNSNAANDIWGWTDPDTGREYALLGLEDGVAFIDISQPTEPVYLGKLPTATETAVQRDLKVYQNIVYIVAEAPDHGLQLFDLTQLRHVNNPPQTFTASHHYTQFGRAHNIAINEASGYAYIVGIQTGTQTCAGGLHMIDLQTPQEPAFAGCFSEDGYTHDTQCVIYYGLDQRYNGRELCFNANTDTLTIVDVTDKAAPVMLARQSYSGVAYAHQGWLTADHRYFLLGDEGDERLYGHNTRTYIWDLADLEAPFVANSYLATTPAVDHNLYIHDNLVFAANYSSGLRVLAPVADTFTELHEVAYFDVLPANDSPNFNGAWSSYPFFASGNLIVSGREQGLFVLRLVREARLGPASEQIARPQSEITHTFTLSNVGINGRFQLSISGAHWPTSLLLTPTLDIAANSALTIPVRVTTPNEVGASDSFTLTAVSASQTLHASGTTTTAVSPAVVVQPQNSVQNGRLGHTITHTLTLTNTGDYTDTFSLRLSDTLWPTTAPTQTVPLAPNAQITIPVQVQLPTTRDPIIVASETVTLTARSGWETAVFAHATATTHATAQPSLHTSGDAHLIAPPHSTITHTLTLTNTGDYRDQFTIAISNNQWTTFSTDDEVGPLAPNQSGTATIVVYTPTSGSDTALVTIRSQLDPTLMSEIQLHTQINHSLYLPLLKRRIN